MWRTILTDRLAKFLRTSSRPAPRRRASTRHGIESLEERVVLSGLSMAPQVMLASAVPAEIGPVMVARPVNDDAGQERAEYREAANNLGEEWLSDQEDGGMLGGLTPSIPGSGPLDHVGDLENPFNIPRGPAPELSLAFNPFLQPPGPMGGPIDSGFPDYPWSEIESTGRHDGGAWDNFWCGVREFFGGGDDNESNDPPQEDFLKVDPPKTGNALIDNVWAPQIQKRASQVHGGLGAVTTHLDK